MSDDAEKPSNLAKGRTSFDINVGGTLVPFFNKNSTPYPTDVSAPKFELLPVREKKDLMINSARMYAEQEYNRIMELVNVLQSQANQIKRRLDITDWVHSAEYNFNTTHGGYYWIAQDTNRNRTVLLIMGPRDWSTGAPEHFEYIARVKYMGDHTWIEVDEQNNIKW